MSEPHDYMYLAHEMSSLLDGNKFNDFSPNLLRYLSEVRSVEFAGYRPGEMNEVTNDTR